MHKIGFFTGKIYRDNEVPEVGECCVFVNDYRLDDELWLNELRERKREECTSCVEGCSASKAAKQ